MSCTPFRPSNEVLLDTTSNCLRKSVCVPWTEHTQLRSGPELIFLPKGLSKLRFLQRGCNRTKRGAAGYSHAFCSRDAYGGDLCVFSVGSEWMDERGPTSDAGWRMSSGNHVSVTMSCSSMSGALHAYNQPWSSPRYRRCEPL